MDGGDYIGEDLAQGVRPRVVIATLMGICCQAMLVPVKALKGPGRKPHLMDLRFCVAVLSREFFPRLTAQAVEDTMLRGSGYVTWARGRHRDRLRLYENYAATYSKCRHALIEHLNSGVQASPLSPDATPLSPTAAPLAGPAIERVQPEGEFV